MIWRIVYLAMNKKDKWNKKVAESEIEKLNVVKESEDSKLYWQT